MNEFKPFKPGDDTNCEVCGCICRWIDREFPKLSFHEVCPLHAAAPEMRLTLERVEKAIAFEMKRAYPDNLHGAVQIEDMDPGHADLFCALGLVRQTLKKAEREIR